MCLCVLGVGVPVGRSNGVRGGAQGQKQETRGLLCNLPIILVISVWHVVRFSIVSVVDVFVLENFLLVDHNLGSLAIFSLLQPHPVRLFGIAFISGRVVQDKFGISDYPTLIAIPKGQGRCCCVSQP